MSHGNDVVILRGPDGAELRMTRESIWKAVTALSKAEYAARSSNEIREAEKKILLTEIEKNSALQARVSQLEEILALIEAREKP